MGKIEKTTKTLSSLAQAAKNHQKVSSAHGLVVEFLGFLKEYSIIGVAMGLVIGQAVTILVKSIVDGLIMPLIGLLVPAGLFSDLGFQVGNSVFLIGPVIGAFINFLIIALMFFVVVKFLFKKEKVGKV